jgi:pentatricopeptide repeat protein
MQSEHLTTRELVACGNFEFMNEHFATALNYYKKAYINQDFNIEHSPQLARCYAKLGLFEEAREIFEKFINQYPDAYIERFQLGMVMKDLNQIEAAIKYFDEVIGQQPNFPPAVYYKALIYLEKNDLVSAKFLLAELLELTEADNLYRKLAEELIKKRNIDLSVLEDSATQ